MLTISPINSVNYYSDLASSDYYTSGGEPAGKWTGLGARYLSLIGQVDTNDYHHILQGFAPDGTPLCSNAGQDKRRHGWDLTFSAPKSLSIIWACADKDTRQSIQAAQFKAVQAAVQFLERHAAFTRRGHNGYIQESVLGLIAATFEHSTSRAQDPQLHTHCLIANVAPRHDGSFGTLDSHHLYQWKMASGALYRATLASQLRQLGFTIEQVESEVHFEVGGVPKTICRHFSQRAEAIEAALDAVGLKTSASHAGSTFKLTTRVHKQAVDRPTLFAKWHQQLDELGLPISQLKTIKSMTPEIVPSPLPIDSIIEQLVLKQAVFKLQDVYTAVAIQAQFHHAELSGIEAAVQELIESEALIELGHDNHSQLFTTQAMLDTEHELIACADALNKQTHYRLPEQTILQAVNKQANDQGFYLSDEQIEAVFSVCQSGLDILQGVAGGGKSTSAQAMRLAYEYAGFKVRGATVARQAAKQLEDETDIESSTLAKLLVELESGKANLNNTVILIDEAGQLSSPDLLQLMKAVHQAGGKLILVGEQQQLDAISHSGSLRFLSQRQGCTRIETIRRQRQPWARQAVMQFRAGNAMPALQAHIQHGLLQFSDNSHQAREQLVNEWQHYRKANPDKQTAILAQRWRDVKPLNDLVRQVYQQQGLVGHQNIELECAISNQHMTFAFSAGERVRFTRNDYRREFTNGELGTIELIEQIHGDVRFTIRCDDGRVVSFNQSDYCNDKGHLYLIQAYATTVYASQGSTIDGDVFVYYTSGMDRSATYVAGSRHKDNCHWFVNNEELDALSGTKDKGIPATAQTRITALARCMSTKREKGLAIEYLAEKQVQPQHQAEYDLIM
ncbi:MAG: conjugative relaxase-like TrwC/TraI family protein [Paraglaciecola sp.]|jgi:conjugative relaxase-like TrwC/TraI family protein